MELQSHLCRKREVEEERVFSESNEGRGGVFTLVAAQLSSWACPEPGLWAREGHCHLSRAQLRIDT